MTAHVRGVCPWFSRIYNQATQAASRSDTTIRTAAFYSQADHHRRSEVLKASAIVNNHAKYNSFVLAEGTLSKSSARASRSDVAEHEYNASHTALSYVNAAETSHAGLAKGHTRSRGTTHQDNELT